MIIINSIVLTLAFKNGSKRTDIDSKIFVKALGKEKETEKVEDMKAGTHKWDLAAKDFKFGNAENSLGKIVVTLKDNNRLRFDTTIGEFTIPADKIKQDVANQNFEGTITSKDSNISAKVTVNYSHSSIRTTRLLEKHPSNHVSRLN